MQIYDYKVVKINAEVVNGKVVFDATGPLALAAKPVVDRINKVFQEEKPISVTDDEIIFSTWIPPIPGPVFSRMIHSQINFSLFKKRTPDQFSIGVTPRCPNKCIHCGAADMMQPNNEMTFEQITGAISQALDMGTYLVTLDGGEPMLRKDLPEIVAAIDKERTTVSMFTSGFRLNEERAKALADAGLNSVKISFDSADPEVHDKFRGRKGAFDDAINAVKNAKAAGIMTDMYLTISPYNIDNIEELYALATDLGMDEMSMTGIIAVGNWKSHEDEVITRVDAKRLEEFHKRINSTPGGPRVSALPYLLGPDMFGCFAGSRWMHVASTGDVLPCPYTPLSFGNVKDEPLAEIWENIGKFPAYKKQSMVCLMRDKDFRSKYIHTIPEDAQLPYYVGPKNKEKDAEKEKVKS
ncbi:PqqA peptide cyclase [Methanosarcinaceae archaeon Ag5]|uniref:PqqA peptide cyclase n=1 Tax=Methanolapillus africanus TaxID=3028297 RepID=A0AAE4MKH9_9EURY|nr:PqqA peptide cyclase [Methanosarcinaceae archaeon Ag5]